MKDKFAVFILTHGRPERVITYKTLMKGGYTGDVYIIVDNEDSTIDEYKRIYGERVIVFDKAAVAATFDEGDNFGDRRTVVYARNACFQIARDLGVDYFLQLDDDYNQIRYEFDSTLNYDVKTALDLDKLFSAILEFYKSIPAVTIAMAQAGDMLGGKTGGYAKDLRLRRKVMNTFFCSVLRPFTFVGRINEDANTYVAQGNRGDLFLTFFNTAINQTPTQSNAGGMTDVYMDAGTYIKSFYTVMYAPSCVVVAKMASTYGRLHHRISWNNAVPRIMHERHCKRLHEDHGDSD